MKTLMHIGYVLTAILALSAPVGAVPPSEPPEPPPSCLDERDRVVLRIAVDVPAGEHDAALERAGQRMRRHAERRGVASVPRVGSRSETPDQHRTWTLTARLGRGLEPGRVRDRHSAEGRSTGGSTSLSRRTTRPACSCRRSPARRARTRSSASRTTWAWTSAPTHDIHIDPGVQILGGRTPNNPGPLLFTTTYPAGSSSIGEYVNADNVRISGIRLQGADPSVAAEGSPPSTGISIDSSLNVEIDNNEISGWHIAAVSVHDHRNRHRSPERPGRGAHPRQRPAPQPAHRRGVRGRGLGWSLRAGREERLRRQPPRHRGRREYRNRVFLLPQLRGHTAAATTRCSAASRSRPIRSTCTAQDDCWVADGTAARPANTWTSATTGSLYTDGHRDQAARHAHPAHGRGVQQLRALRSVGQSGSLDYGAMEQTDGEDGINQWGNTFGAVDPSAVGRLRLRRRRR